MRASTWNVPRFLYSFGEAIDGGLIVSHGLAEHGHLTPRGTGSRVEITDGRSAGRARDFTFTGTLTSIQRAAVVNLAPTS